MAIYFSKELLTLYSKEFDSIRIEEYQKIKLGTQGIRCSDIKVTDFI